MSSITHTSLSAVAPPSAPRLDKQRYQWGSSLLLLPAGILIAAVFVYGVGYSIYLGLTNLSLLGPTANNPSFTGTANITQLLHDHVFFHSLLITFIFVFGSGVVGATLIGLALAVLMQHAIAAIRMLAGMVAMIAFMLPPVTIAIVWYAASVPGGTFSQLIGNPNADPLFKAPLVFVSLANTWSLAGLSMLLFGAALRNIPADIIEAAKMEGASGARRFFGITLPLLKPTIVTSALLMTLLSLANFTIVWLMTAGGPGTATTILPVYSYQQGFQFDHLAYGALLGNVMVLLTAIFGVGYVKAVKSRREK
ncbi:MAG: carbohydrate ABC transporter permease [Solirubrobacteraceae bacterium]